jgi:hypothetical protein
MTENLQLLPPVVGHDSVSRTARWRIISHPEDDGHSRHTGHNIRADFTRLAAGNSVAGGGWMQEKFRLPSAHGESFFS